MSRSKHEIKKNLPRIIKVGLVDDQQLFRAGISSLLKEYDDIQVVLEATNGKDLVEQLRRQRPHVVLLDIEMNEMNGIETTMQLKEKYPDIKVIILTMHNEEEFIFDLMTKGAHGFLPKDKSVEEVVDAIYAVVEKGRYYNEEVLEIMVKGSKGLLKNIKLNALTEKELQIIKMLCKQKSNKEIADEFGVSIRTIENYRTIILDKTGTKNLAGLVLYALKNKIISRIEMM
jgi:two-component system response regulator DegU